MIPRRLTLKNFLSYRDATLDFSGLHIACICGANGAGKSSLLEAIAWAIWGESRAATDDDVIHLGETEARVDFVFDYHQRTYRVIRTRYRGQSSVLEFQLETPTGWRSLTEKGMRATQQLILQHLKLDYETFINSAYLRQGRADEFMLKRPSDRKQILADLLKLDQYDVLEEKAKERSRQCKAELGLIERNLEQIDRQLEQAADLDAQQQQLTITIEQLQQQQSQDAEQWRQLQDSQQQRQSWQQQLTLLQQQYQQGTADYERLQQELAAAQQQQQEVQHLLQQAEAIATGYAQWQTLQAEDDQQTAQLHAHQSALSQRQALQQQQTEAVSTLKDALRHVQAQIAALNQQEDELRQTLGKSEEIQGAIAQLHQARARLVTYDHRQLEASPLMQRRQQIQTQIDRIQARLSARLDELQSLIHDLQQQQQRQPALQQSIEQVAEQVSYLEQRRLYQQKVREKGLERRSFLERLQERQRELEQQLSEIDHKIQLLQRDEHSREESSREKSSCEEASREDSSQPHREQTLQSDGLTHGTQQTQTLASPAKPSSSKTASSKTASPKTSTSELPLFQSQSDFPPCPLCDRPLDQHHWSLVIEHHQRDRQDILDQLWVIREQLTTSDREIKVLRQEYRRLEKELAYYGPVLERRGQLQEQLQGTASCQQRLQQLCHEQAKIQRSLDGLTFAPDLQDELRQIDQRLAELNYDDRTHALARGEVDRWRWAEIKQAELRQAERRLAQLAERKPHLQHESASLEQQLAASQQSPLQQQIDALDRQIAQINYSTDRHTAVRHALKSAQGWQGRYQALEQAQQRYPQLQQQVNTLTHHVETRSHALQALRHDIDTLRAQLSQCPDASDTIQTLDAQMQQRRSQLDDHLAQLGRLQQQQQQLALLHQQRHEQAQQIPLLQRHYRVYQELAQAFSKNGIQALMIENLLPQLETEANQILGRLSNHQLHIQFVTQRSSRRRDSVNRATKLIDTLDILIGNLQGTRPYETYSGGEAFRVNFAIRLALARLLAQRSGTALQLLVIDEGFGTQDEAGCDRLIAAINAIAADFACILTVTHMPHLKEAFQTRVEISKTDHGSQINLLV